MSTTSTLTGRRWAFQRRGDDIYLYEIDSDKNFIGPSLDITNGLKVEYIGGDNVFLNTDGERDNTSPDEDSTVDASDGIVLAIIEYVRAKLAYSAGNSKLHDYHMKLFNQELSKANDGLKSSPHIAIPKGPYAIR